MPRSIVGIYRNGIIELAETPADVPDGTPVIVTLLDPTPDSIDLQTLSISEAQAAELRARFGLIAEDWDRSDMAIYDNYDNAWDVLKRYAGTVEAPPDWSLEHDHYLYGTPKRYPDPPEE